MGEKKVPIDATTENELVDIEETARTSTVYFYVEIDFVFLCAIVACMLWLGVLAFRTTWPAFDVVGLQDALLYEVDVHPYFNGPLGSVLSVDDLSVNAVEEPVMEKCVPPL